MVKKKCNDSYSFETRDWYCWDWCCYDWENTLYKNGVAYTETYEDNWDTITRDINFTDEEDAIEFILNKEFNIKINRYTPAYDEWWFIEYSDSDYLIYDWYDNEEFENFMYILKKEDYLDNLELKNLTPKNVKYILTPRKEPIEVYTDLFEELTWCEWL